MKIGLIHLLQNYPEHSILIIPNNKKFVFEMYKEGETATDYEHLTWTDYNNDCNYYLKDSKMILI